tara:strand:+ start:20738 stop:21307 length:570 start_codon:yes stop_codon:yes gene_type:complete
MEECMKSKIILFAIALVGCGQNQEETVKPGIEESPSIQEHSTTTVFVSEELPSDLIPNGRWLINKRICSKQLLPGEYYDFTVDGDDITYIGITQSSTWMTTDPSVYSKRLSKVIEEQAGCFNLNIEDFFYIEHTAPGNKFTVAVNAVSDVIVRFSNSGDSIGSPFERNQISKFEVIFPEWYEKLDLSTQ